MPTSTVCGSPLLEPHTARSSCSAGQSQAQVPGDPLFFCDGEPIADGRAGGEGHGLYPPGDSCFGQPQGRPGVVGHSPAVDRQGQHIGAVSS